MTETEPEMRFLRGNSIAAQIGRLVVRQNAMQSQLRNCETTHTDRRQSSLVSDYRVIT